MDPITMMVASVGMQFFSNYKNNAKSKELQQKQFDFQKAALDHDFERARILQADSAKLALELENEVHQQRLEDIQHNYDDVLHNFATGFTIKNWPINVLPFVMRGESFGSLFAGMSKSISVHCIFTPSNCTWFNTLFYDDIDLQLESEMNNNWNAQSTHPVVYYGGGWNRRERVMVGNRPKVIPSIIDLDDIDLIYTKLKSVPTVVITPYFDTKLYFRVRLWGMGDNKDSYRIEVSDNNAANGQFCFTYEYEKDVEPEQTEVYLNTSVSEFVQYLESLVGAIVDKYFWNFYGVCPLLPFIKNDNSIPKLVKDNATHSIQILEGFSKETILQRTKEEIIELVQSMFSLLKVDAVKLSLIKRIFNAYCSLRIGPGYQHFNNWNDALSCSSFSYDDLYIFTILKERLSDLITSEAESFKNIVSSTIRHIIKTHDCKINETLPYITICDFIQRSINILHSGEDDTLCIEINTYCNIISSYFLSSKVEIDGIDMYDRYNVSTTGFLVPQEIFERNNMKFKINKRNINNLLNKLSLNCDKNILQTTLSIDIIKKLCDTMIDNIEECTLYFREAIPSSYLNEEDFNIIDNLVLIKVENINNEIRERLIYVNDFDNELKGYLLDTNILTIQ